jgi:hypothetical protein
LVDKFLRAEKMSKALEEQLMPLLSEGQSNENIDVTLSAEQVAQLLERHPEIIKARVEVTHDGTNDAMTVRLESPADSTDAYAASVQSVLKLRANVDICEPNSLPNDGLVIADLRDHG